VHYKPVKPGLDNHAGWHIIALFNQQEETSMLKSGVSMFFTDYSMAPGALGVALEQRGFESLWAPEHSHIPLSRKSPFPSGGDLPKRYYDAMDPFVTLTAAAAATSKLMVGTGVCLVPQRDPIQTAKLVASIDQVSGGRFLFGIGNGWNQDELEDHGVKFADRHKVARERVEAMKAIWTLSKPEYHGEFVNFDPMMTWPKPVQKPHPPVIVGGAFPYSARRAIRYGNGWIPQATRGSYSEIGDLIPEFRKMATAAGRNPDEIAITVWFPKRDLDLMKRYADLGVERVVFNLDSEGADKVVPVLDEVAAFMQKVNG
jgi:probable F420-dependent oxidoreductase